MYSRLRYLAELAARKQRCTVSSLIEWAIERGLDAVPLSSSAEDTSTIWKHSDVLWDVDEADRFVNVLICENGYCWRGHYNRENKWTWEVEPDSAIVERIREHWNDFRTATSGDVEAKKRLPTWKATQSATDKKKRKGGSMTWKTTSSPIAAPPPRHAVDRAASRAAARGELPAFGLKVS